MKKIQLILSTSITMMLVFGITLLNSCKKGDIEYNNSTNIRPCDNIICLNGGTCKDGVCHCPQGFEGTKCTIRWSDRFIGTYAASDECMPDSAAFYDVNISANADYAYKINLSNLGTFCPSTTLSADINPEKTSFAIPLQKSCGNNYLSGYGNLNGNYINVYLIARDTLVHETKSCSILLSKK